MISPRLLATDRPNTFCRGTRRALKPAAGLALLLALSPFATPSAAEAQVSRADQIQTPELPGFAIPTAERHVLSNGMVVFLLPDPALPLVDVRAVVRTGARFETSRNAGLASVTGDVLRSGGTTERPSDQLDDYLEDKAASIESSIGSEFGQIAMSCLSADFPELIETYADMIRRPAFEEGKIQVSKSQVTASIARRNDEPQGILFRELTKLVYGEQSPYTLEPTYASLQNIDREAIVDWYQTYFHPNRIILGVTGDIDPARTLELIEKAFGDWPAGPKANDVLPPVQTAPRPGVFFVEREDVNQSNIALAHLGIRRDSPEYYATAIVNDVLSGGFSSRLFSTVRSNMGLAYSVFGAVDAEWDHPGLAYLVVLTKVETTGAAIDALLAEARRMRTEPPTADEVQRAKTAILNSFIFQVDTKSEILDRQLSYEYYGYPLDYLERYRAGIEGVTVEQVAAAAKKNLRPGDFSILVVGPSEGLDKPLDSYGDVTVVDIATPEPPPERAAANPESLARGKELVAAAAKALGGDRLDAIKSLHVVQKTNRKTPQGEVEIGIRSVLLTDGSLHQQMSMPQGKLTGVLVADDAWVETPGGVFDLPASQADGLRAELSRHPLLLLRHRGDDGFRAVAAGTREVDGQALDLVEIEFDGLVTYLALDPETHYLAEISYLGQGPDGSFGTVRRTLSDYRAVDGLQYPFSVAETFEGEATNRNTLESVEVDAAIDPSFFDRTQ